MRVARGAPGLMRTAKEHLAAMGAVGACRSKGGLCQGVRDRGAGLGGRCAVAEGRAYVGAEEGEDEKGGEALEDPAGSAEAEHSDGRGGSVWCGMLRVGGDGHGSFTLRTASHGWSSLGAGFRENTGISPLRFASVEMTF